MTPPNKQEGHAAFLKLFRAIAPYKHRYEVFDDFVTMTACSLHNSIQKDQAREDEYLKRIAGYKPDDQKRLPELLAIFVGLLDTEPRDVLGQLYMELEIANKDQGQFFTPSSVSELMANLVFDEPLQLLAKQEFITVSEPACGAGGMILAFVKTLIAQKLNPSDVLWVECIDVHRMAALMCYVQLSLWNVPAQVIVGNTLTLEHREVWHTPAHYLGLWSIKLKRRSADGGTIEAGEDQAAAGAEPDTQQKPQPAPAEQVVELDRFDLKAKPEQLGFDF